MPSEVVSPGTRMLRFLTPTEEWARRIGNPVSVPAQWPFMLAEIFVAEESVHLTIEPGSAVNKDVLQLAEWADW
jgi:hypothetical protein